MPLQNPQDIAAHAALDTGVHGVGAATVCSETKAAALIATHAGLDSAHIVANGSYTGNAADVRNIPHGLGRIPQFVIIKKT
ncbi:unnamed protein product, partial [marine sediment metagenome]